jgi:hypothetical protein
MTEVELPDGTIIEFPDGTPPETMKAVAAKAAGGQAPAPKQDFRGGGLQGSRLGAGIAGAAQGVPFIGTFADEAKAGIRSLVSGNDYQTELDHWRGVNDQMADENPLAFYGGQVASSVALPGAALKAGLPVWENALRLGSSGAIQGAAYGYGAGEGDMASRARHAALPAAVGGAVGAAVPFALKGVQRALDGRATRRAIDAAADAAPEPASLARQSGALYESARKSGVVVKGDAMRPLLDDLAGMERLDADFTPDAIKVIDRLTSKLEAGDLPFGELEALHRRAGLAVTKNRIANPADAGAAGAIAQKVDEFMMNMPDDAVASNVAGKEEVIEMYRQGRQLWKQFRNSERLQEIVEKAEISENPAGAIRSGFRAILTNKNKRATYSPAELQVMRQVISESKAGNWVQRLIGYGTGLTRQVVATSAGYGVGGPIGAALGSAAATKIGSVAKEAAGNAAMEAGSRAARFSATGGQFAQPAPHLLPQMQNALRQLPAPAAITADQLIR